MGPQSTSTDNCSPPDWQTGFWGAAPDMSTFVDAQPNSATQRPSDIGRPVRLTDTRDPGRLTRVWKKGIT
jgi:hypothetical protein